MTACVCSTMHPPKLGGFRGSTTNFVHKVAINPVQAGASGPTHPIRKLQIFGGGGVQGITCWGQFWGQKKGACPKAKATKGPETPYPPQVSKLKSKKSLHPTHWKKYPTFVNGDSKHCCNDFATAWGGWVAKLPSVDYNSNSLSQEMHQDAFWEMGCARCTIFWCSQAKHKKNLV